MKNKKIIAFILIIIILLGIILYANILKNQHTESESLPAQADINYNEDDEMYEIRDENNEIIANSVDKASLQIYLDDPNYNP